MIHFEDLQGISRMRIAQAECIEPGAEDDRLTQAARDSITQTIFGEVAACRDEEAHQAIVGPLGGFARDFLRILAQQRNGEWIGKDGAAFEQLMRGSMQSRTLCRDTRFASHRNVLQRRQLSLDRHDGFGRLDHVVVGVSPTIIGEVLGVLDQFPRMIGGSFSLV
jgi:hypothetical protein